MHKSFLSTAGILAAALVVAVVLDAPASAGEPPKDTMLSLPPANAAKGPPIYGGKAEMNGYSLKDFPDFIKEWHFVTVRYRKDTGEMRLTYANDKAWAALLAGGHDYPDGAVFAKIGIMTKEDPGFTSSVVPSGAKRYQLMVMDHKKHAATDGWGYALFDMNGRAKTFEQNPEEQTAACHACHKLVPERDYVFSQPMRLEVGVPASMNSDAGSVLPDRIAFTTKKTDALPPKLRGAVPPGFREARVIEGELAKHLFQGTIDEIRPTLTKEAMRSNLPAILVNEAGTRFSMVIAQPRAVTCPLADGKTGMQDHCCVGGSWRSMLARRFSTAAIRFSTAARRAPCSPTARAMVMMSVPWLSIAVRNCRMPWARLPIARLVLVPCCSVMRRSSASSC